MNTTIRIDVLNPKALRILKSLAELDLIVIKEEPNLGFEQVLKKLRSKEAKVPTLEEITAEVEKVRSNRYKK